MTDRTYRILLGASLLIALYFELPQLILALIVLMLIEGITNWRMPLLLRRLSSNVDSHFPDSAELIPDNRKVRLAFDAERAWRVVVSLMLVLTVFMFHQALWFFPWFMGFAILGAGISGVCPVLISLKFVGFR